MQIENDYDKEVYNGDIGTIHRVDHDTTSTTSRLPLVTPVYRRFRCSMA
jgi:ATP-dependent exoDNAse (exonuclease V) alpha subunit